MTAFIEAGGHRLEYQRIAATAPDRPPLAFLHEGLGSVELWRGFPAAVAAATGAEAVVWSRYGYGRSDPFTEPRSLRYMHDEADLLPGVLDRLGVDRPVLVGHSDGASISLIHAATQPATGLVLLAPHVFVEDVSVAGIEAARHTYETTDLGRRMARYHTDADTTFRSWNDVWLAPGFRSWDITEHLPHVEAPMLVVQGLDDQYGTTAQVDAIVDGVPGPVESVVLAGSGHSPHLERPDETLAAVVKFYDSVVVSRSRRA